MIESISESGFTWAAVAAAGLLMVLAAFFCWGKICGDKKLGTRSYSSKDDS